jgi:GxxExxY protein
MTDNDLSREIIGAAIEVHKQLGPGLLESAYEECLAHELQLRHLKVERQRPVPVVYKQVKLECGYRIDILVEGRIVVELKSVEGLAPIHEAIVLTYLRLSGHRLGLLINFNVPILKNGVRRFVMSEIKNTNAEDSKDAEIAEKTRNQLGKLATHG